MVPKPECINKSMLYVDVYIYEENKGMHNKHAFKSKASQSILLNISL